MENNINQGDFPPIIVTSKRSEDASLAGKLQTALNEHVRRIKEKEVNGESLSPAEETALAHLNALKANWELEAPEIARMPYLGSVSLDDCIKRT